MAWWVFAALPFLFLLFRLWRFLCTPITVGLDIRRLNGRVRGEVEVRWSFLRLLRLGVGPRRAGGVLARPFRRAAVAVRRGDRGFRQGLSSLPPALDFLRQRVVIREFRLACELGAGDPVRTAWAVGAAWSAWACLLAALFSLLHMAPDAPRCHIHPNFQARRFRFRLRCIATIRLWHVITAAITFARQYRRRRKGARQRWPSIPSRA